MIYILLPAYNEERALSALIPAIDAVLKGSRDPYQIVVVNDGSADNTYALLSGLAKTMPVRELRHPTNLGYGSALRTGYLDLIRRPDALNAIVVSLDADGTHGPEYIPSLCQKVRDGWDIVTASYTMPGGSVTCVPPLRKFFSQIVNGLFKVFCPVPGARTYSNGFRAYRLGLLQKTHSRFKERLIEESGFAGGTELFLKAAACGGRAGEVPFALHYERRGKDSKIRFVPTIFGYLKLMITARGY